MIEIIVAFFFGFCFSRVTTPRSCVDLRKPDKILAWNQNCLGWRPVTTQNEIKPDKLYLAAFELNSKPLETE